MNEIDHPSLLKLRTSLYCVLIGLIRREYQARIDRLEDEKVEGERSLRAELRHMIAEREKLNETLAELSMEVKNHIIYFFIQDFSHYYFFFKFFFFFFTMKVGQCA